MKRKKIFPEILVGEEVVVVDSTNLLIKGLVGEIIDETRNTLSLKTNKGVKKLLKSSITLKLKKSNKIIKGTNILKKPEDRLKG